MKTEYEGLWLGRTAWYVSKPFTKKKLQEMPAKFRLIVRENKFHKNNKDGTPRFIFAFADAETANRITELREREPAKWHFGEYQNFLTIVSYASCSECDEKFNPDVVREWNYCPNCGAYMGET